MKAFKGYLFIIFSIICGLEFAFAQFTINSADVLLLNTRATEAHDTTGPTLNLGNPGFGNTWDFTGVTETEVAYNWARDPQGLPGFEHFSEATMAFTEDNDSTFLFFQKTSARLSIIGAAALAPEGDTNFNKIGMDIITFPSTILTTFNDDIEPVMNVFPIGFDPDSIGPHPFIDSLGIVSNTTVNSVFDAHGTLKTDYDEFEALRQNITTTTIDSVFMYVNGGWKLISLLVAAISQTDSVSTNVSYGLRFWGKDIGFPVASVNYDPAPQQIHDFGWLTQYSVSVAELENLKSTIKIYPNPANERIFIEHELTNPNYSISNNNGKIIERSILQGSSISVSGLPEGQYLIHLYNEGRYLGMEKFQVSR